VNVPSAAALIVAGVGAADGLGPAEVPGEAAELAFGLDETAGVGVPPLGGIVAPGAGGGPR
jgi:hypothetical protein